jgi:(E)-4-hydroxy-3-methyl-but-2-enyl pyrophosphate reductase (IPP and DMAPP forming)
MTIKIDSKAGFCFGVVSAINLVEKQLQKEKTLFCLGDIVHNNKEVERLSQMGLKVISKEQMEQMHSCKVIIRAHGEPPQTYALAHMNNIEIIDATCPIVLALQKKVKQGYEKMEQEGGQVVIFGKKGHAEVIGLVGQTEGKAIVISSFEDLDLIDYTLPAIIYSQTTMDKDKYIVLCRQIDKRYKLKTSEGQLTVTFNDTICHRVAGRAKEVIDFADSVDVLLFVSGKDSSNGMYLYSLCSKHKDNTYLISSPNQIEAKWFCTAKSIGISGATSTPMWLMKQVADKCISLV